MWGLSSEIHLSSLVYLLRPPFGYAAYEVSQAVLCYGLMPGFSVLVLWEKLPCGLSSAAALIAQGYLVGATK